MRYLTPKLPSTPIEDFRLPSPDSSVEIKIKRDDYFPFFGGGSKARKACHIVPWAISQGYDSIVTNGGINSNHARATALACAAHGLECELVLHTATPAIPQDSLNLRMARLSGATIRYCTLDQLASYMDNSITSLKDRGLNPMYLWGGGHCTQGALAYYYAAIEAREQTGLWTPDFLVVASGTGTTQAGLLSGFSGTPTRVIGVSIAREIERGKATVLDSWRDLEQTLGRTSPIESDVEFLDEWRFGGYELFNEELVSAVRACAARGLLLDPTYTGKAWTALIDLIASKTIPEGSKVLFWHTGGTLNLLSHKHLFND